MIWGDKAIARLTELVATGVSYTTIGMKMHITKNAAIGKARRLKLAKFPSPSTPYQYKKSVFKPKPPKPRPAPKPRALLPKEVPPKPPKSVPVPDMRLVSMMQLTDEHCRYPIDINGEMLFCGRLQDGKPPYCEQHSNICYMPPREPVSRSGQKPSTQFQRHRPAVPSPHRTSPK